MPAPRKKTSRKKPAGAAKPARKKKKARGQTSATAGGRKKKSAGKKRPPSKTMRARTNRSGGRRGPTPHATTEGPQRLQKVLAAAGVASRRECEQLVLEGRVEVDRQVVTKLGTKVDPETQKIRVDGTLLKTTRRVYFAVNKPQGVVSTARDPAGRPRVIDMIPETSGRVFTVGRLDMASEGLILLTNDGELANQLTHPRYGVDKTYEVQVAGEASPGLAKDLVRGIHLAEDFVKADAARIKRSHKKSTVIEIVLSEGKNREIRRMLARLGHKVQRLRRVAMGPLKLGELPEGHVRQLEPAEVKKLRGAVAAASTSGRPAESQTRSGRPIGTTKKVSGSSKSRSTSGKKATARPAKKTAKPIPILKSPLDS